MKSTIHNIHLLGFTSYPIGILVTIGNKLTSKDKIYYLLVVHMQYGIDVGSREGVSTEIYHELYISSAYDIFIYRCGRETEVQYRYQVSPIHVGTPSFSIHYSYYMVERVPCTLHTSSSG